MKFAALVAAAGTRGDDLAFLGFFLRGVGDDDAALSALIGLKIRLDEDAIVQWTKLIKFLL